VTGVAENFKGSGRKNKVQVAEMEKHCTLFILKVVYRTSSVKQLYETKHKCISLKSVKVKLSLCFNWAPHHEGVLGSGGIVPCILDLGTRWK
jgi:hypothetical protein